MLLYEQDVLITSGCSGAVVMAIQVLVNEGKYLSSRMLACAC